MAKLPYFSIVMPTYKRPDDLRRAIKCILRQTWGDYEIIICDNDPLSKNISLIHSYKDNRIKYHINSSNIGFIKNVQRGVNLAKGKYIILHSDDDFMLWHDCLEKLHSVVKEKKPGFVRLNFLSYSTKRKSVFKYYPLSDEDHFIAAHAPNEKIIEFIHNIDPIFITGLVFERKSIKNERLISSEWGPWLPLLFRSIQVHGGIFLSELNFAAFWLEEKRTINNVFFVVDGKITFENFLFQIHRYIRGKHYVLFKNIFFNKVIGFLPAVKYFTGNANTIRFIKRVLELSPDLKISLKLWVYAVISLCSPDFALSALRVYLLRTRESAPLENGDAIKKQIKTLLLNS